MKPSKSHFFPEIPILHRTREICPNEILSAHRNFTLSCVCNMWRSWLPAHPPIELPSGYFHLSVCTRCISAECTYQKVNGVGKKSNNDAPLQRQRDTIRQWIQKVHTNGILDQGLPRRVAAHASHVLFGVHLHAAARLLTRQPLKLKHSSQYLDYPQSGVRRSGI